MYTYYITIYYNTNYNYTILPWALGTLGTLENWTRRGVPEQSSSSLGWQRGERAQPLHSAGENAE